MVCFLLEETAENGYVFTVCDFKDNFGDTLSERWFSIIPRADKRYVELSYDKLYFYFSINSYGAFDVFYLDSNDYPCTNHEMIDLADEMTEELLTIDIAGNNIAFYDIKLKLITIYRKYTDRLLKLNLI